MERQHIPLTEAQIISAEKGELKLETRDGRKVVQLAWLKQPFDQSSACSTYVVLSCGKSKAYYKDGRYDNIETDLDLFVSDSKEQLATPETFNIENYTPKGAIEGFPIEVVKWMLSEQVAQGNKEDVAIFEKYRSATKNGFAWHKSNFFTYKECIKIIKVEQFDVFFAKFPKQPATTEPYEVGEIIEVSKDEIKWYRRKFLGLDKDGAVCLSNGLGNRHYYSWKFHQKKQFEPTVIIEGKSMTKKEALIYISNL